MKNFVKLTTTVNKDPVLIDVDHISFVTPTTVVDQPDPGPWARKKGTSVGLTNGYHFGVCGEPHEVMRMILDATDKD